MSRNYDNWGKLVAAVLKKQQYLELAHLSRSPSICSEASDESSPSSSFNSSVHDADFDMSVPSSPSRLQKAFSKLHQKLAASSPSIGRVLGQPLSDIHISYKFGREISRTQFSVTYLVTHRATRHTFTCKSIGTQKLVTAADVADIQREVNIMHHLTGVRNIVELKEVFEDRYNVHLVMELCVGGELFDRIIANGYYSERKAAGVCRQMVTVVDACHSLGVMHRDLKPENFLLLSEHEDLLIKATDFRLSVFFRPGDVFNDVVGSAYYVAPEVLCRNYGEEADIWSVGVILYILLSGVPPFWGENEAGIFDSVLRGHLDFSCDPWPSISSSAKDLVKNMLVTSPKLRFTAVEVLSKFQNSEYVKHNCLFIHFVFSSELVKLYVVKCTSSMDDGVVTGMRVASITKDLFQFC